MVEFALIVPVFLLLVIGIISFGRVFFVWNDANHLANETARWAAVDQNPYAPVGATPPGTGGRTLQQHVCDNGFADASIAITYQNPNARQPSGDYLKVCDPEADPPPRQPPHRPLARRHVHCPRHVDPAHREP